MIKKYKCSECGETWFNFEEDEQKCPFCECDHVNEIEDEPAVSPVFTQIFHSFGF